MATVLNIGSFTRPLAARLLPDEAHIVQFYTHGSFLLDGLNASLGNSLKAGESVVVVMTKAHQKGLLKRLSAQGINLEELRQCGRLTILDASETLTEFMYNNDPNRQRFLQVIGGVIRRAEAAAETKGRRVSVYGEMVAVLWRRGQCEAAIRLEQLWNELAQTHFFYLHCAYPAKWFNGTKGDPYSMICAEHSVVIRS